MTTATPEFYSSTQKKTARKCSTFEPPGKFMIHVAAATAGERYFRSSPREEEEEEEEEKKLPGRE